jgi:hypothetical protein
MPSNNSGVAGGGVLEAPGNRVDRAEKMNIVSEKPPFSASRKF